MKYFLVIRNAKSENENVLQFDHYNDLKTKEQELHKSGHNGELVPCHGASMKEFLDTFTEYRPKNWRQLLTKHK